MKWLLKLMSVSALAFGMSGCDVLFDFPKKIQELPESWKVLEPGTPRARFPTLRVITEGGGAVIGPGDLVEVHIKNKSRDNGTWHERGNWWIWIGFRTSEETSFFSTEPRVASALVGMREGSVLKFVDGSDEPQTDPNIAGVLSECFR